MLGVTWWDSLLITAILSSAAFPLAPHMGIQAESTGTAGGYFYNSLKVRGSYSVTLFSLEIVPPPVCLQRVRDDARCDCSTCRCRRKGEAIVSLLPVSAAARRSMMSPTSSIKLILLSATRRSSPRSLIWVFTSRRFSLLLWDVNCHCQMVGRWTSRRRGPYCTSGWRYSPSCHPMPCCDRCYPSVQSRA